jgi:hypothetical protein
MITAALAYSRARLSALRLREWDQDHGFDLIPNTALDSVYYLNVLEASGVSNNHDHQVITVPLDVMIFAGPTRNVRSTSEIAISRGEAVIADFIRASNRLLFEGIKDVKFDSMNLEPIAESNDNGSVITIRFSFLTMVGTR